MAKREKYVVSNTEAEQKIRDLKEFRNQKGTLRGVKDGAEEFGRLPKRWWNPAQDAEYVVYSYRTPIAWVTADGERVVPDIGYSSTTGQHQYTVKDAWREAGYSGSGAFPARGRETVPAGGGPRSGGMDESHLPWHQRTPARGAGYPPMGARQG